MGIPFDVHTPPPPPPPPTDEQFVWGSQILFVQGVHSVIHASHFYMCIVQGSIETRLQLNWPGDKTVSRGSYM